MAAPAKLMTFEEFEAMPDEPARLELLDGELIRLPLPFAKLERMRHRLERLIETCVDPERVWMLAGYLIRPDTWLRPAVSIAQQDQPGEDYLEGAPLLAVEVITPRHTAEHLDCKVKKYLAHGAVEVWAVYRLTRCVWVFRRDGAREYRDVLQSDLIPGLRIDLNELFA